MDHHCPWVDNCVAMHNQRYFLLFITYMGFDCFYYLISVIVSVYDEDTWHDYQGVITFQIIMPFVIGVAMIFFNSWNWYLAFQGTTAIDFWQE